MTPSAGRAQPCPTTTHCASSRSEAHAPHRLHMHVAVLAPAPPPGSSSVGSERHCARRVVSAEGCESRAPSRMRGASSNQRAWNGKWAKLPHTRRVSARVVGANGGIAILLLQVTSLSPSGGQVNRALAVACHSVAHVACGTRVGRSIHRVRHEWGIRDPGNWQQG